MRELSIGKLEMVSGGSWFSKTDECFGLFHELTPYNTANWAIIAVFNSATLGGYTLGSLAVCGTYGAFAK